MKKYILLLVTVLAMAFALVGCGSSDKEIEEADIKLSDASVGEIIHFGNYNSNDEWIVLERRDNKILVISKDIVEYMPFNDDPVDIRWKKCSLRSWLNYDYYDNAFTDEEKALIVDPLLASDDNREVDDDDEDVVEDKIFLLSIDEVNKYFKNDAERIAEYNGSEKCWWLRTRGCYGNSAAGVIYDGSVDEDGTYVHLEQGVRPVMWISVE